LFGGLLRNGNEIWIHDFSSFYGITSNLFAEPFSNLETTPIRDGSSWLETLVMRIL